MSFGQIFDHRFFLYKYYMNVVTLKKMEINSFKRQFKTAEKIISILMRLILTHILIELTFILCKSKQMSVLKGGENPE